MSLKLMDSSRFHIAGATVAKITAKKFGRTSVLLNQLAILTVGIDRSNLFQPLAPEDSVSIALEAEGEFTVGAGSSVTMTLDTSATLIVKQGGSFSVREL